jgi:hypothetical protein
MDDGGFLFAYHPFHSGNSKLELTPGLAGESQVSAKLSGEWLTGDILGPPIAPLGLPLRVQTQMSFGGACFEAVYDADGVRTNRDGKFRAAASR